MLVAIGLWTRQRVEGTTKAELASRLQTLLNADVAALRLWFSEQEADVKSFAADAHIRGAIVELAGSSRNKESRNPTVAKSPPQQEAQSTIPL